MCTFCLSVFNCSFAVSYSLCCILCEINYTLWSKNCHPFSFHYSFYKCWPISTIFGAHYTKLICNTTVIDLYTSPTYCCCISSGKFICCFWLSSLCASDDRAPVAWNSRKFIPLDLWPPSSPDLNPVDYRIWSVMQNRAHQTPVWEVVYPRQHLIDTWKDLSQRIVGNAVDEWRKRLQVCVNEKGGHLEQLL